MADLSGIR